MERCDHDITDVEWKKPFHDDSDTLSDDSGHGLIEGNTSPRWKPKKGISWDLRLGLEAVLVILVLSLSTILAITDARLASPKQKGYGPKCKHSGLSMPTQITKEIWMTNSTSARKGGYVRQQSRLRPRSRLRGL